MQISEIMNLSAQRIRRTATMHQAADLVASTQVSDLMVVEDDGTFVGVLSEGDLIRAVLPQYDEIVASGGSLHGAFEIFVDKGRAKAELPIEPLIIRNALSMSPNDPVLRAATTMIQKQIRRLPVVEKGKLVGTVSRGDICRALLTG